VLLNPATNANLVSMSPQPGVFPYLFNRASFFHRFVICLDTEEQPVIEHFPNAVNRPGLSKNSFYSRYLRAVWEKNNNRFQLAYGRASRFAAVPDAILTMYSDEMPVTAAQADLLMAELFPGPKRTRVSEAEWTNDLEKVTVSQLIRQALPRARRTKFIEDLRECKTFYIGGRTSDAQVKFYDKVPGSVVRIEHTLRRGFFRRHGIRTPSEVFNLRLLDINELISLREISELRLERAIKSWSPSAKAMARDYLAFRRPLPQFVQFLRANGILPEAVLVPSEVHLRLESMARRLVY
jgi:hypothetical protein